MFVYEKKLQYPVKIANPNPKLAAALGTIGVGDAVLVKASRVAGLDRLAAELTGR